MEATAATSICELTLVKTGNPYYVNFGLFRLPLAIPVCPVSPAQAPPSEGVKCLFENFRHVSAEPTHAGSSVSGPEAEVHDGYSLSSGSEDGWFLVPSSTWHTVCVLHPTRVTLPLLITPWDRELTTLKDHSLQVRTAPT